MRRQGRDIKEEYSGDVDAGYEADDEAEDLLPRPQRRRKMVKKPTWHKSMRLDCTTIHDSFRY